MYRLSLIINEVYLKYLPLAEKVGITLNLDFPDTTTEIEKEKSERVKLSIDKSLRSAIKTSLKGEIKIEVLKNKIVISDSGTVLSEAARKVLEAMNLEVKTKIGFGTTVTIRF